MGFSRARDVSLTIFFFNDGIRLWLVFYYATVVGWWGVSSRIAPRAFIFIEISCLVLCLLNILRSRSVHETAYLNSEVNGCGLAFSRTFDLSR